MLFLAFALRCRSIISNRTCLPGVVLMLFSLIKSVYTCMGKVIHSLVYTAYPVSLQYTCTLALHYTMYMYIGITYTMYMYIGITYTMYMYIGITYTMYMYIGITYTMYMYIGITYTMYMYIMYYIVIPIVNLGGVDNYCYKKTMYM